MARAVRIRAVGGWYHVFSRGHNREAIFGTPDDYRHFVELPGMLRDQFRVTTMLNV